MRKRHTLTREQVERRKDQAVKFTRDVVGDPDRADEIEGESLESYAERRKLKLENPTMPHYSQGKTRAERMAFLEQDARRILAAPDKHTAAELKWAEDMLEARSNPANLSQAVGILQDAYRPAATRAELAQAIGEVLDLFDPDGGDAPAA
jgi:hypothetical protein